MFVWVGWCLFDLGSVCLSSLVVGVVSLLCCVIVYGLGFVFWIWIGGVWFVWFLFVILLVLFD